MVTPALDLITFTFSFFMCNYCVHRRKKHSKSCEISVSSNMAYGQVKLEPRGGEYEDPDKIRSDGGNYEVMQHSADDECSSNKLTAAVYTTAKDASS